MPGLGWQDVFESITLIHKKFNINTQGFSWRDAFESSRHVMHVMPMMHDSSSGGIMHLRAPNGGVYIYLLLLFFNFFFNVIERPILSFSIPLFVFFFFFLLIGKELSL
jgi:hypothetical protein